MNRRISRKFKGEPLGEIKEVNKYIWKAHLVLLEGLGMGRAGGRLCVTKSS